MTPADAALAVEQSVNKQGTICGWQLIGFASFSFARLLTAHGETALKGNNDAPPNFREVSAAEYVTAPRCIYGPIATNHRQILRIDGKPAGRMISVRLFILGSGEGWAEERDHNTKTMRYYFFELCQHEHEVTHRSMCYREYKCKKCGYEHSIDSSD